MDWIQQWQSKLNKQNGVAPLVRTGGSRHTGLAALPYRNIQAKLHKLLDNKPIEYVAMALSGEMQAYCEIEDEMVKGMFGTIVQGYLKKGYNRATAEMMAREFFRYES